MGQKEAKRLRKLFRREIATRLETSEAILGNFLKPRPRWCPRFVWNWMLSQVFEETVAPPKLGAKPVTGEDVAALGEAALHATKP